MITSALFVNVLCVCRVRMYLNCRNAENKVNLDSKNAANLDVCGVFTF